METRPGEGVVVKEKFPNSRKPSHWRVCGQFWNLTGQYQFSSVTQSCPTLYNPVNHIMPGLPVYHQLPESTPTHVHRVGDAIKPSHPLSSPSPALNLSQHHGLFKWVSSLHQVAKVSPHKEAHIKSLPAMQESQETRVQSLGREDPLEEGLATHSSILAWRIPRTEEPGGLQPMGSRESDTT